MALRGKGYNNHFSNLQKSGELKSIKKLSNLDIKVVFDIGANTGQYSQAFLENSNAKIFAFEPMKKSYEKLINNTLKYGNRITGFNYALGEKENEALIYFNTDEDQLASLSKDVQSIPYLAKNNVKSTKIQVRTIDNVFMELTRQGVITSVDVIKIDTEGFEFEVLQGARSVIKNNPPKAVIIEFNWHQLTRSQTILNFSKILVDYVAFQILPYGDGIFRVDPMKPENNIFFYSNFIFLRNDCAELFSV